MEEINHDVETSGDESGVLRALRSQIRDLEKELKTRPVREDLELEIRNQQKRESSVAALLTEQGHPAGLARFALSEIGEADLTAEAVQGFLKGIGYDSNPASSEGQEPSAQSQQLAEVSSLAARVSSAASSGPAGLSERIAGAKDLAELNAIMVEAGALQS